MKIRVELDWLLEVPDGSEDLEDEVRKIIERLLPVPFGEFADEFTVANVEELNPWESS